MTMAAAARGITRMFVPEPQVAEASLVPGMEVLGFRSLAQVVAGICVVRSRLSCQISRIAPSSGVTSEIQRWRASIEL